MAAVVVGGTYRETCSEPIVDWTYGSGVRAAVVLGVSAERLVTVADEQSLSQIPAVLGKTPVDATPRLHQIEFTYDTPLSPPRLLAHPSDYGIKVPQVEAIDAVVFGMVEARPTVVTQRAVVDPQHSLSISQIGETIIADELVIVANSREIRTLAGDEHLDRAVGLIFDQTDAVGVVIKAGALGALVLRRGADVEGVPAIITSTVFPIGSGDVFTAALALHYFESDNLADAAHSASRRTAEYVETRQLGPVQLNDDPDLTCVPTVASVQKPPGIYVAASFANPEQRWSAGTIANGIEDIGGRSVYPLRDVGQKQEAEITAWKDLNALDDCDAVVVLADVARTGPFFEAGWATSRGLPIVVMNSDPDPDRYTMLKGTGAKSVSDLASAAYFSVWAAIEHRHGPVRSGTLMLLSGGLDSAAVAAIEQPTRALFVDYGQIPVEAERRAARAVALHLSIELDEVSVDLSAFGSGLLVGTSQILDAPTSEWFPFRNQLLATVAAAHAIKHGLDTVLLGLVAGDGHRHADGTPQFVSSLDMLTCAQEGNIRVRAPQIKTLADKLLIETNLSEELMEQTHSCHASDISCNRCPGCRRRDELLATVTNSRNI